MSEWGKWVRDNFDKLLLVFVFIFLCLFTLHIMHDQKDVDLVLWGREMCGTVLGALLGLITGHALAQRTTTTSTGGSSKAEIKTE